jgi:hypothetical protein
MLAEQERTRESGCQNVVPKPIDFAVLRRPLLLWLDRSAAAKS